MGSAPRRDAARGARLLRRCLERDPASARRLRGCPHRDLAGAARAGAAGDRRGRPAGSRARAPPLGDSRPRHAAAAAARPRRAARPPRVSRLLLHLQPRPLTMAGFALSPDGPLLAYVANGQIHVRALDREGARVALGSPRQPSLLLPGRRLDRLRRRRRATVQGPARGRARRQGRPTRRTASASAPGRPTTPSCVRSPPRLGRESCCGYRPAADRRNRCPRPHREPGSASCGHTSCPEGGRSSSRSRAARGAPSTTPRSWCSGSTRASGGELVRQGTQAVYSPTGDLVFGRGASLLAVPFELVALAARGAPLPVAEHVSRDTVQGGRYALAAGRHARLPAGDGRRASADVGRPPGRAERIAAPPHKFLDPRVSPDGSRIAVQGADGDNDVWICDLATRLAQPPDLRPG